MLRFFVTLCCCVLLHALAGQTTYKLGTAGSFKDMHLQAVDEERFLTVQSSIPADEVYPERHITVSAFDQCGIVSTTTYTHEYIWGVDYIVDSWIEGDSMHVLMAVNASVTHSHREIAILSIHTSNYGNRYTYLRADNVAHVRSIDHTPDGNYIMWCFFSYTDRAPVYGALIVDRDFTVLDQYINFPEYTVSGSLVTVPGGYIANSATTLLFFDQNLDPQWAKSIPDRNSLQGKVVVADGIIMLRVRFPYQMHRQQNLIKIDFDGNVVWESTDLQATEYQYGNTRLLQKSNGNIAVVTHKWEVDNQYTDALYYHEVAADDGRILASSTAVGSGLFSGFRFVDLVIGPSDTEVLLLRNAVDEHLIWPLSPQVACTLRDTIWAEVAVPQLELLATTAPQTLPDAFETGSYELDVIELEVTSEQLCLEEISELELLPSDTTGCQEQFALDLTKMPYDIIWEDGSTDKLRNITVEGMYSYEVDHCDISYSESVLVRLERCACSLVFPNIINRSSLGDNGVFQLNHECTDISAFDVKVYDRWGNVMYQASTLDFAWDGTLSGSPISAGVYVYAVAYTSVFSEVEQQVYGTITVL